MVTVAETHDFSGDTVAADWATNIVHGTGYSIVATPVYGSSTKSYKVLSTSSTWAYRNGVGGSPTLLTYAIAFYCPTGGSAGQATSLIEVANQAGTICFMVYVKNGAGTTPVLSVGGVDRATGSAFSLDAWHVLVFQCELSATATIKASIDGVSVGTYSGDTSALGTSLGTPGLGIEQGVAGGGDNYFFDTWNVYSGVGDYDVVTASWAIYPAILNTASATLHGSGTLTATALNTAIAAATLHGSGTLTAAAGLPVRAAATLHGSGTLTAAVTHVLPPVPGDVTIPLFTPGDYTLSGTTITLTDQPLPTQHLEAWYAVTDEINDVHSHAYEEKDTWGVSELTWTLGQTPEPLTLQVFKTQLFTGNLWQTYSDFHTTTNQYLHIAQVDGDPAALNWSWAADGPWALPAGETITCMAAMNNKRVFLCCVNGGTQTLYRFDRETATFHIAGQWSGAGVGTIWQIYMVSEQEWYLVFRQASAGGIRFTLDGGVSYQLTSGFAAGGDPGFIETPKGPYGVVGQNGVMTTVHTAQWQPVGGGAHPGPNDLYWALSETGDGGVHWSGTTGTSQQFWEGQRGAIWNTGSAIEESFNSFGTPPGSGVGGGNDASNYWAAAFYLDPDKVIFGGNFTARISTSGGSLWAALPGGYPAPAVQPYDVMHVPSVDPATDYLIVPNWDAQNVQITTDYGVTWQTFALPNYCGKAAWAGGRN